VNNKTCPDCGARLDPQESCDCKKSEAAPAGTETTSKNEPSTHMVHREAAYVKREVRV
jgi:hypothetical protein